jgi:DUF4097 and DUF4098 domain-containing protein YvlB
VNRGNMTLNNVDGFFNVENVNGGIEMNNIGGSGRAYAVNGAVSVAFTKNPTSQCYIGSLNGAVTATLPNNLSADLRFKTFNGNAYTNFDVTPIALAPKVEDVSSNSSPKKGKYVYRSKGEYGVRVGAGGVELSFDAFNGTINVLKREK